MFWGLVLEPGKRYTQDEVEDTFHISMACIDPGTTNDGLTSLLVDYEGQEYVLCTLSKKGPMQQVLDLNFAKGDTLSFYTSGKSTVHLSGYLMLEDDVGNDTLGHLLGEEEGEEEEDDEEAPVLASNKRKSAKEQGKKAKKAKLGEDDGEEEGDEEMSDFFDESGDDFDEDDGEEEEEEAEEEEEETKPQPKGKNKQQQAAAKSPAKPQSTPAENGESASKKKSKKEKKAEAAVQQAQQGTPQQQQKQQQAQAKSPSKKTLPGGLVIEDLKEGSGPAANVGKHVSVYYSGRLPQSNKPFDSTLKGQGFRFKLGAGEVIKGWDQGLQGMKVGGKRRITVPAPLGYGKKGSPPVIPPNSTLIFDVELKSVQ